MNLEPKTFYKIGSYLFGVVAIMNLLALITTWNMYLNIFSLISAIASNIFNFLLCAFFIYLYKQTPEMPKDDISDEELRKMVGLAPQEKK
ncbi:hypothetical protein KJ807_05455 [Patescibacteria group bacterium]|nr:hypothetical protein [Patescibacteria group bacterium]